MKKTLSLLLAIIVAAVSICTLTICAFADETTTAAAETTTAIDLGHPGQTEPSTVAPTEASNPDDENTSASNTETTNAAAGDDVVTNPSGVTSIDDGDETSKKPANVDDEIPSTGSNVVLPAIALLALAGGVAVAVKSKKD